MSATVHALGRINAPRAPLPRASRAAAAPRPPSGELAWFVDVAALANCRALFSGHEALVDGFASGQLALLEVPVAYDQFCRSHFASVQRLHPELAWEDACPAYAVALSAHAVLFDALDEEREAQLAANWLQLRGQSGLDWQQARSLVADGCSALARLDPLAMRR
jgi:hypothetical protein